jgi:DNA-binding beta-propeller fold protein YncE
MSTVTQLASGLAGAIGSSFRATQNQLLFVEFGGKLSKLDLFPHASVVSSGSTILKGTFILDLETGTQGGVGPAGDIWWRQKTAVEREMTPRNAAKIVNLGVVNFNAIGANTLQMLSYGTTPIPGNDDATNKLVPGDVFAVRTSLGNYAKVKVTSYGYNLAIQWVTYHLNPAYAVIGTGYTEPEDVEVSASNTMAYITERGGNLLRVSLVGPNANRASATVITSGMTAPHQIALDEANGAAYVVEFASPGHLWRIDLATGTRTAIVSNLNRAIGLVLSADRQFAYVSEQTGGKVSRITLSNGATTVLASALTAPFMLSWADAGQTALLVAERDPANRVTRVSLGGGSSVVASGLPARPSSVALTAPGRMLVCSDTVVTQVDFLVGVLDPAGPLLMGIGFVPFDKIAPATGLATTDPGYFYHVTDAPFGGTLPIMINHQHAANIGATHYRVRVDGSTRSDGWSDYRWNGVQYQLIAVGPTTVGVLNNCFPVHPISDLFLWMNPSLGMLMASANLANGLHTIRVDFINGAGTLLASSTPLTIMVNNQSCVGALSAPTLGGASADACGVLHVGGGGTVSITFTASHPQDYGNWSISVIKGATGVLSQGGPLPPAVSNISATSAALLAGCPMAGFAAYLHVGTTIQNGWGRQSQFDASDAVAFVLAP